MISTRILLFIVFASAICWPVGSALAVTRIDGVQIDRSTPSPPSGLCLSGVFDMSQFGVLSFTETSSLLVQDVAPLQQSYDGFGYLSINNGVGTDTLYVYNLDSFTVTATAAVNVANAPDTANTFRGSRYNSFTDLFQFVGNQPAGGGCLQPNGCVHTRGFPSGSVTPLTNIISGIDITASTFGVAQIDSLFTYMTVENLAVMKLHRINSLTGASVQQENQTTSYTLWTQDGTYLYADDFVLGTNLIRYTEKSNLTNTATFTFTTAGGGVGGLAVNNGFLYIGVFSDGVQLNRLHKVNLTGFGTVDTILFLAGEFVQNVLLDSMNQKLYVVINSGGTTRVKRVDIASFTVEQTYNGLTSTNGPSGMFTSIDVPHQKLFAPSNGGGGFVTKVEKINLCG